MQQLVLTQLSKSNNWMEEAFNILDIRIFNSLTKNNKVLIIQYTYIGVFLKKIFA